MKKDKTAPTMRSLDLPRLVVELPDGKEIHHHITGEEITIGRDPKNRISIPDNFISKFHAKLLRSKTSLTLVDLDSANKTYVNDQPITQSPVRYGDRIRFGAVNCRLEAPESHAQRNSPPAARPAPPAPPEAPTPPPPPPVAQLRSVAAPAPVPRAAPVAPRAAPPNVPGRSAPPPIEADPMKRLLRIGGLLILVSAALATMLRVMLVPSETPEETEPPAGSSTAGTGAGTMDGPATAPPDTSPPPATTTAPPASTGDASPDRDAEYYFDEGLAHLDTGRLREARQSFERALSMDPDHSRARTRLSLLEEEIEKKAERHFDNARQAFQFLRYDEAIAEWEMFQLLVPESDPRHAEAQQGIEQAKAKLR